jgi:hypothetical protein
VKKKLEVLGKTTHGKSTKEAYQQWIDQLRKKHQQQLNQVRRRKLCVQHRVPWDPGGSISEIRRQKFSCIEASMNHRNQYPVREFPII